jgi:RNA polymerase sigma-70 factor (ECF subfamily)
MTSRGAFRTDAVPAPAQPDATLVARVRAGDAAALGEIFTAHYATLCGFAASYVGTAEAAEELVQELFLHLWATRTTWEVRGELRAYLFGAVRNRALNAARRWHLESKLARVTADAVVSPAAACDVPGYGRAPDATDAAVLAAELEQGVREGVARLPERLRAAVHLRWRAGMSYAEIAAALGLSQKGVDQRLRRAFKILRSHLAPLR